MSKLNARAPMAGLVAAFVATAGLAAGLSGAQAAKDRQAHMKALGAAAKALGEQMRSGTPDPATVKLQAARIDLAAKAILTWFPVGSGREAYDKSHALPLIWTDPVGFAAAQKRLVLEAGKLDAVAAGGDLAAVGTQFRATGAACKACHEKFKAPDKA